MMPLHDSYKQGASPMHLRCELNNRNVMYIEISSQTFAVEQTERFLTVVLFVKAKMATGKVSIKRS